MEDFAKKIDDLRLKLNCLIDKNADYRDIYKVSVELDKMIAQFYVKEEKAV